MLCAGCGGLAARARDFLPAVGDIDARLEVAGAHRLDRLKLALEAEIGFQFREDGDDLHHGLAHRGVRIDVLFAEVDFDAGLGALMEGEHGIPHTRSKGAVQAGIDDVLDTVLGHEAEHIAGAFAFEPRCLSAGILEAIDEAFRLNRYGDIHREIGFHQAALAKAQEFQKEKRNVSRLESIHLLETSSGPYYHFTATDLTAIEVATGSDLHTRLVHRGELLTLKKFEGEPASENIWAPDEPFAYNAFRTFLALLADFDADFLLSQISEAARIRLDRDADAWRDSVSALIFRHYTHSGDSEFDVKSIRKLAPSWAKKPDSDFSDAFMDALPKFCNSRKRGFIRGAIENAQRLALAGRKPVAIAVEFEEDILRAWRSFLSQYLRGCFTDDYNEEKEQQAALRVEAEIENPRPARPRYTESE